MTSNEQDTILLLGRAVQPCHSCRLQEEGPLKQCSPQSCTFSMMVLCGKGKGFGKGHE